MMRTLITTSLALLITAVFGQPGANDPSFDPGSGADGWVRTMVFQPDGKILVGGDYDNYNGTLIPGIARINGDGSLDPTFDPGSGATSPVWAVALQTDGKVLIGGQFTNFSNNGTTMQYIARFYGDGSLDASFHPGTGANDYIYALTVQPDGKILVGGLFETFNGTARNYIARLNSDGTVDPSFDPVPGADNTVGSIVLQPDGKILIGGHFTTFNGTPRNRVARLNSDGSLDTSFDPGTGLEGGTAPSTQSMARMADGKILIGGSFETYNGTSRKNLVRLNSDGTLDTGFDTGAGVNGDYVLEVVPQADGKVVIGGGFTSYNGTARINLARIETNGNLDAGFDPGTGPSDALIGTTIQPDGKILIGGIFQSYDGTPRNRIARVMVEDGIGIEDAEPLKPLLLAPNPVTDHLRLSGAEGTEHWSITDAQGSLVRSGTLSVGPVIDVSSLAQGHYMLVVSLGDAQRRVSFNKL